MDSKKKEEILKARKDRDNKVILSMLDSGIALPFKIEGVSAVLIVSDRKGLKQYILGLDKPNPEGIPVAKLKGIHGKDCKPVKVRLTFYDGNIKAVVQSVEGVSLDDEMTLDDELTDTE